MNGMLSTLSSPSRVARISGSDLTSTRSPGRKGGGSGAWRSWWARCINGSNALLLARFRGTGTDRITGRRSLASCRPAGCRSYRPLCPKEACFARTRHRSQRLCRLGPRAAAAERRPRDLGARFRPVRRLRLRRPASRRHSPRTMDVRDVESEDLVGFDAVIHLAAVCNDPVGDLNPRATYEINHEASVRVAEKAKEAGVGALPGSPRRAASTARRATTSCSTRAPSSLR